MDWNSLQNLTYDSKTLKIAKLVNASKHNDKKTDNTFSNTDYTLVSFRG